MQADLAQQKEAIEFSWNLLTKVYDLDPGRLYVTYFEGDPKTNLQPDLEAKQLWLDVGVPEDHILPGSAKDNFWGEYFFRPSCST
jgi:alanyl-tRNA synthetase